MIWAASVTSNASASRVVSDLGDALADAGIPGALQRLAEQDQAQRGHDAELKTHIPQRERIEQQHDDGCHKQRDDGGALPSQTDGDHEEDAHERGAGDGGISADQQGVQNDAADGD